MSWTRLLPIIRENNKFTHLNDLDLPEELKLIIFGKLTSAEQLNAMLVSRAWFDIIYFDNRKAINQFINQNLGNSRSVFSAIKFKSGYSELPTLTNLLYAMLVTNILIVATMPIQFIFLLLKIGIDKLQNVKDLNVKEAAFLSLFFSGFSIICLSILAPIFHHSLKKELTQSNHEKVSAFLASSPQEGLKAKFAKKIISAHHLIQFFNRKPLLERCVDMVITKLGEKYGCRFM